MALDDNELLDFPTSNMPSYEAGTARRLLREHGEVFRAQLVAARWIEGYANRRRESDSKAPWRSKDGFEDGAQDALRDIAAHLRQGDFLPGGSLYEDEQQRDPSEDDE